jgi:dipeptidyl aminopeptidase/acylaminoacyl peptidase
VPRVRHVVLSPDGQTLAWEENGLEQPSVVAVDVASGEVRRAYSLSQGKLRRLEWADDQTLLMDTSRTVTTRTDRYYTDELFRTVALDIPTGRTRVLLMNDGDRRQVVGAALLATRTAKPHTVTMATWDFLLPQQRRELGTRLAGRRADSGWVQMVYAVDTHTGKADVIEYGSQFTDEWIVDAAGIPVARSEWDPTRGWFTILVKQGLGWRNVHHRRDRARLHLLGLAAEGDAILALGANGHDRSKLWAVPLDGSGARVLIEDAARDVESVIRDPYTRAPLGVTLGGLEQETRWLDAKAEARWNTLRKTFPDRDVRMAGRSEDGKRVLAHVESPTSPPTYYLIDFGTGKATIVGESYPQLANAALGEVRSFTYKARDGADIPAYLTLPPGDRTRALPLVVLPHGGPESRDDSGFDWRAQFLATRGYAVLQPQFRGSTGFGEAHRKAGYREWGGLMQNDVTDGVRALITRGLADPGRVCIVGSSYGGYVALAGAAFTPDLYACAVSVNGISDLADMLGYETRQSGEESDSLAYWRDHIGNRLDPRLAKRSPAKAAAAIKAPVLLLHGADDTVVPVSQSEKMARALEAGRQPHEFVRLAGEDHWLSSSETRVRVLTEIEAFLADNLGRSEDRG